MTDAVLCIVTVLIALKADRPLLFRIAAAMFSAAALLGTLRFSGLYVDPSPHMLVSMVAGVAAFPAVAAATIWPKSPVAERWMPAVSLLVVLAIVGASITLSSGSRVYVNLCALVSVSSIGFFATKRREWLYLVSATILLFGLASFATGTAFFSFLQPADILHVALTVGLLGLSIRHRNSLISP